MTTESSNPLPSIGDVTDRRPAAGGRIGRLLAALTIGISASYLLRPLVYHTDDAFITYQFARNLASGSGYVYHPQFLPLQGSSSPLHVAILGLLGSLLPVGIDELGFLLGALGTGLLAFILSEFAAAGFVPPGKRRPTWLAAAPLTFFTASALSFGLEAVWAALLLVTIAAAVAGGRPRLAAVMACALILVRPDWGFFLLPSALAGLLFHGRRSLLWWIPSAVVLSVYLLASRLYFGEAVPFTWLAKMHIPDEVSGVLSWPRFLRAYWGVSATLAVYVLVVAASLVFWRDLTRERRRLLTVCLLLLIFAVVYTLILGVNGAPDMPWYFVAPVTMAAAAAMSSLPTLRRTPLAMAVPLIVASHILAFASISQAASIGVNKRGHEDRREVIGRWIASNDQKASARSVAAFEVGKIAFYSRAKVHDILGLVSREGADGMRSLDPGRLVRTFRPDYVTGCDCPDYLPMSFLEESYFRDAYRLVFSRDDYRVWRRFDLE
jgi:hypothetical protein